MKALATIMLAMSFAAVALGAEAAVADTAEPVAPAYPQAVSGGSGPYSLTYLTNDPVSKVSAFYASHRIQLAKDKFRAGLYSAVVLDQRAVCLAEKATHKHAPTELANAPKGVTDFPPDTARVTVSGNKEVPPKATSIYQVNVDKTSVFSGLQSETFNNHHTKAEFLNVYNKYRWLEAAYYPQHKTSKGSESYYKWLVATTWAGINAPQEAVNAGAQQMGQGAAAIAARMQKLIAEGHMQEAQKLGEQMSNSMQGMGQVNQAEQTLSQRDHWKQWMAVVKKLVAHAYKTKIVINKKPATWPMHNICGE